MTICLNNILNQFKKKSNKKSHTYQTIENFFQEQGFKFTGDRQEKKINLIYFLGSESINCCVEILEDGDWAIVKSYLPLVVSNQNDRLIRQYLTQINSKQIFGSFDFLPSGMIIYKTAMDIQGDNLTIALARNLFFENRQAVDNYLPEIKIFTNINNSLTYQIA